MNIRNEMTMRGIADAEQLGELTRVLDDYCDHAGIQGDHPARERLARRIMSLFNDGIVDSDQIKRALDSSSQGADHL
jgi:hypothetical protein